MLLKLAIATNLLLLVIAATIENNETVREEYDKSTLNVTEDSYLGVIGGGATTTENITGEWVAVSVGRTCNSDQWQCADLSCVPEDYKCDGALHCDDGSDETRANCNGTQRDMLGLMMYCIVDRANLKDGVCPDVCKVQPEYCAYALLAEQETAPPGVCALPDFVRHGSYKITNLNRTSDNGYSDFSLDFECDQGTELVGEANPECVNGTWNSDFPYCSDTCKLNKKTEYIYTCKRGEKSKPCGDFVAIGTEVIVEKHDKKISNSSITAYALCTERRVFNVSSACVDEVDSRQDTLEKDVMNKLTDFENKFKETKHPSFAFEELVRNYRNFEQQVTGNSTDLSMKIAVCDINLDLIDTNQ